MVMMMTNVGGGRGCPGPQRGQGSEGTLHSAPSAVVAPLEKKQEQSNSLDE